MRNLLTILLLFIGFVGYGQTYRTTKPNAKIYKDNNAPFVTLATLGEGETVKFIEKINDGVYKVQYRDMVGIMSNESLVLEPALVFNSENRVEFTEVVEIPGVNKDELYSRAKQWIAVAFKSANAVIQMDDKAEGILIGKGKLQGAKNPNAAVMTFVYNYGFTVKVFVKDGKYKYSFTDITYEIGANTAYTTSSYTPIEPHLNKKGVKDTMVREMIQMGKELNVAMSKPSSGSKDW